MAANENADGSHRRHTGRLICRSRKKFWRQKMVRTSSIIKSCMAGLEPCAPTGGGAKLFFFSFSAMLLNGRVYADDFALKRLNMEMLLIYF